MFESLSVRFLKEACISRKAPKYRLFCYLQKAGITEILQLRVKKKQA